MPALIVVPIYYRISFINFGECIKNILWHIKNICPVCGHPALHRHCVCCCVVAAAAGGGLAPADGQRWRRRRHPGPSSLQWTPACSTAALKHSLDKVGRISDCSCENRSYLSRCLHINCCFAYYEPNEVSKLS